MKKLLKTLLSWLPFYKSAIGGYWFYKQREECRYRPEQFLSFGENVQIADDVVINKPERLKVGNGVLIEPHCHIRATGGCSIGNYTGLGQYSSILTTDHQAEGEAIPFDDISIILPVIIGDHVWIGSHVAILGGVTIGEGAIIGLGSVVRRDIPAYAIAMGNPARVIGYRDKEHFNKLKERKASLAPRPSLGGFIIYPDIQEKYRSLLDDAGIDATVVQRPTQKDR